MLNHIIAKLIDRQNLTAAEAEEAMRIIMTGQATPAQIGGYLIALRMKGETVDEITGSARAMRAHASRVTVHVERRPAARHRRHRRRRRAHLQHLHRGGLRHRRGRAQGGQARQPRRLLASAAAPTCWPRWASTST